jgi:CheY-like chemotaxis protein
MTKIVAMSDEAPKILIADDDPSIVRLLSDRCTRMGFKVETAANGVQALLKANRGKPDILIIDVNMPEADGLAVCAHLLDPVRKALDVIVITANQDSETIERCESFGAFYACKGPDFWASFVLALVKIFPDREGRIREVGHQPAAIAVRKRSRVLVIDDDADVGKFLSSRLAKRGVDTLYASGATQGYRMACKEEPSVIISDYFMPDGDVRYLLSRLRTTPATANIPVVVLSGGNFDQMTQDSLLREVCGHPGAVHVLRKAFDTHELFEVLQKFCGFEKEARVSIVKNQFTERA